MQDKKKYDLIKKMKKSYAWKEVCDYIDETVKDYEEQILQRDHRKNVLTYSEHDIHREVRYVLLGLKNLPDTLLEQYGPITQSDLTGEDSDIDYL